MWINLIFLPVAGLLIWLWSRDLGLVIGLIFVACLFWVGEYGVRWGSSRARENDRNMREIVNKRKLNTKNDLDE